MAKRRFASLLQSDFLSINHDLDGLDDALDKYAEKIQGEVLMAGVARMANVIYDEVRLNAEKNKKSGLLQSAVYRMFIPARSNDAVKTYIVSVNKGKAPHWHFAEYGTSRQPAYPFIRPAYDKVGAAIEAGKARMAERMADGTGGVPT